MNSTKYFKKIGVEEISASCRERNILLFLLFSWYVIYYYLRFILSGYTMLPDDAFYYLKTAYNYWEYGYATFDGFTKTNGYHPLWYIICVVVAIPFSSLEPSAFFVNTIVFINIVLSCKSADILYKLLIRKLSPEASLLITFVSFACSPLLLINGMETSLSLLCYLYLVKFIAENDGHKPYFKLKLSLICLVTLLSRLDNGLLLMILFLFLPYRYGWKKTVTTGLLLTVFSLPYFTYNQLEYGGVTPVSGKVKQFWGDLHEGDWNGEPLEGIVNSLIGHTRDPLFFRTWKLKIPVLQNLLHSYVDTISLGTISSLSGRRENAQLLYYILPILILTSYFIYLIGLKPRSVKIKFRSFKISSTIWGLISAILFLIIQNVYYWISYGIGSFEWYFGIGFIGLYVFMSILLLRFMETMSLEFRKSFAYILCFLVFIFLSNNLISRNLPSNFQHNFVSSKYHHAVKLKELTDPDIRIGSWGSGALGYYSNRNVVNLEGLISSPEVYRRNREINIHQFILDKNIKYLCEWWTNDVLDFKKPRPFGIDFNPVAQVRRRALFDYWPALTEIASINETKKYPGHIWKVDHSLLTKLINDRVNLEEEIASLSIVLPAEKFNSISGGRTTIAIIGSNSKVSTSKLLMYDISNMKLNSEYSIYARLYSAYQNNENTKIIASVDENLKSTALKVGLSKWQVDKIYEIDNNSPNELKITLPGSVYIDDIYFVHKKAESDFNKLERSRSGFTWGSMRIDIE